MPRAEVERVTGCSAAGLDCVRPVSVAGRPHDERYIFRGGGLAAVAIDFPTFEAGLVALRPSLGDPGWQGDECDKLDDQISEAEWRENVARLGGVDLMLEQIRAHEDARQLERQKLRTPHLRCASWSRDLTHALLCEEVGQRTTALFTSRAEPQATPTRDWHGG
jgi:hypothetical protein